MKHTLESLLAQHPAPERPKNAAEAATRRGMRYRCTTCDSVLTDYKEFEEWQHNGPCGGLVVEEPIPVETVPPERPCDGTCHNGSYPCPKPVNAGTDLSAAADVECDYAPDGKHEKALAHPEHHQSGRIICVHCEEAFGEPAAPAKPTEADREEARRVLSRIHAEAASSEWRIDVLAEALCRRDRIGRASASVDPVREAAKKLVRRIKWQHEGSSPWCDIPDDVKALELALDGKPVPSG